MKNLVIDVGNTHVVFGVYDNYQLLYTGRFSTQKSRTEDEYFAQFNTIIKVHGNSFHDFDACGFSTVVPELQRVFTHFVKKYLSCPLYNIDSNTALGITYASDKVSHIGSDLVVNAYAAWDKYQKNCLICDLGTATTIQLITKKGQFLGTAIAPGLLLSASKLFEIASQLAGIQLYAPEAIISLDTKDCLRSGIVQGHAFMIDGFVLAIKKQYDYLGEIMTIATGGISRLINDCSAQIDTVDTTLTLDGLNRICHKLSGEK